jgi:hypothetical protein
VHVGSISHLTKEDGDEILERHRPPAYLRSPEAARREVALERSQEASLEPIFYVAGKRLVADVNATGVGEVQNTPKNRRVGGREVERNGRKNVVRVGCGQQRIRGSKIDRVDSREGSHGKP